MSSPAASALNDEARSRPAPDTKAPLSSRQSLHIVSAYLQAASGPTDLAVKEVSREAAGVSAMSTVPEVWRNIPLHATHARWRALLQREIPALLNCRHSHFLSLHRYFSGLPERFFSASVFKAFLAYLEGLSTRDAPFLRRYLRDNSWRLNQAFFILTEINAYGWHDKFESLAGRPLSHRVAQ